MRPPFRWDPFSDQPAVILDKGFKRRMRMLYVPDYLKMAASSALMFPAALAHMALGKPKTISPTYRELIGMGVSLEKGPAQIDLIHELGVQHVLLRVPLWEIHRLKEYQAFGREFKRQGHSVLVNLLQDREHIENHSPLKDHVRQVFDAFKDIANEFQVGNAINRAKWGFFAVEEYLKFFQAVQACRDEMFPGIELLGPAVIDFEYHFTIRALFNSYKIQYDRLSALLYVDRMGAPENRQYGVFDTERKMRLLGSLAELSPKVKNKGLYITEVNWPLKGTAPYAPTSEKECVSEEDYCQYMLRYFEIARRTGCVSRVYWHQLIAPGYGLVDSRDGFLRKMPAFGWLRQVLAI